MNVVIVCIALSFASADLKFCKQGGNGDKSDVKKVMSFIHL